MKRENYQRRYTREFKEEAVCLLLTTDKSVKELARELGTSQSGGMRRNPDASRMWWRVEFGGAYGVRRMPALSGQEGRVSFVRTATTLVGAPEMNTVTSPHEELVPPLQGWEQDAGWRFPGASPQAITGRAFSPGTVPIYHLKQSVWGW